MTEIQELSRILRKFQEPLRLHERDISIVLHDFGYLKQRIRAKGYPDVKLVLTGLYCYVRSLETGRKVVGSHEFVKICKEFGLDISTKDLWRYQKLYYEHEFYSPITSSVRYFEAIWEDLIKAFPLPPAMREDVISLLQKGSDRGGKRGAIAAAAVYKIAERSRIYLPQKSIAQFFGITEVALRQNLPPFQDLPA